MLEEQLHKEDPLQVFEIDPGYASDPGWFNCSAHSSLCRTGLGFSWRGQSSLLYWPVLCGELLADMALDCPSMLFLVDSN